MAINYAKQLSNKYNIQQNNQQKNNKNKMSYSQNLSNAYNTIKNRGGFQYDSANDKLYQQYASQAIAMNGMAIANNQQQAQDLTGGYGSTYAPLVARQGLTRINAQIQDKQPNFYTANQGVYDAETDRLINNASLATDIYGLNADKRSQLANENLNKQQNSLNRNQEKYERNYQKQGDINNFQFQMYDTYNNLAGVQCAEYNEKGNNKGMKQYLAGLVKEGKITQYMADNLYNQYKYTPPKSSSSRTTKSRTTSSRTTSSKPTKPMAAPNTVFYYDEYDNTWRYGKKNKKSLQGTEVPSDVIGAYLSNGSVSHVNSITDWLKGQMDKSIVNESAINEIARRWSLI